VTRLSLRGLLVLAALALAAAYLAKDFAPRAVRARLDPANTAGGGVDAEYARFLDGVAAATPRDATVCVMSDSRPGTDGYAAYWLAPRRVLGPERYAEAPWVAVYRRRSAPAPAGATELPGGFLQKK
jgi:hypothetical protein